jgi:uncharacterized protein YecE (DUF72 family)
MMHPVTIGTCGWSYKDWVGNFYPAKTPAGDFLSTYAERYAVVEVDSSFYATPSRRTVEGWRDKTPEGFRFCLKVPQSITHEKLLKDCDVETDAFVAAARILGAKLHCAVLQFGYFNKKAFASQDEFLERLERYLSAWPGDIPIAVEVRNKAWMNTQLAASLRKHQAVWVLADQVWMPSLLELIEKLDVVTGPFGYVRLLGDRKAVDDLTETLDRIVVGREAQLRATAQAIWQISARVPVLAFVNNHYAGHAPTTARQLEETLASLRASKA